MPAPNDLAGHLERKCRRRQALPSRVEGPCGWSLEGSLLRLPSLGVGAERRDSRGAATRLRPTAAIPDETMWTLTQITMQEKQNVQNHGPSLLEPQRRRLRGHGRLLSR